MKYVSYLQYFTTSEFYWKTEGFHYKVLRYSESKTFDRKLWQTRLLHKTFPYRELFETLKAYFTNFYGNVRQQVSDGNSWYSILPASPPLSPLPPCFHKPFGYLKVSGTENSPTKNSRPVKQHIFDGKSLYSILPLPPLVVKIFSEAKLPSNTKEIPHDISWSCEKKYFRRKILISPLLSRNFLDSRFFLEHRKRPLRNFLVL